MSFKPIRYELVLPAPAHSHSVFPNNLQTDTVEVRYFTRDSGTGWAADLDSELRCEGGSPAEAKDALVRRLRSLADDIERAEAPTS